MPADMLSTGMLIHTFFTPCSHQSHKQVPFCEESVTEVCFM
jgi:hypothetical protein